MKTLLSYLRYRRLLLVYHLAATGLILLMFYLLRQEMLYAFYTAGLLSAMLFAFCSSISEGFAESITRCRSS